MQQDRVHNATEGNTLKFKSVAVIAGVQELSIERHEPEALNPESAGSDPSTPAVLKTAQGRLPERKHNRSWSANLADFIFGGSSATSPTREQPIRHRQRSQLFQTVDFGDTNQNRPLRLPSPPPVKLSKVDASDISPSHFTKLKLIGKGDVGKVYLVRHRRSNTVYAMKVLNKMEMIRRDKIGRVLTEQQVLLKLQHPFIVKLYFAFQSQHYAYLCLDYCAGGEFFRMLQTSPGRRLNEEDARFYAAEIVCALEYLHLMGFIYRDLKPENVLIAESGHIMLVDFDLAKASDTIQAPTVVKNSFISSTNSEDNYMVDTNACLTGFRTNSFVGTEEYIAPEMLITSGHTSSVEWWTLGIFLYEMLVSYSNANSVLFPLFPFKQFAKTPFKGQTRNQTFRAILKNDLNFPNASYVESISISAKNLIRRLLCKDPSRRLGSRFGAAEVKSQAWFRDTQWALLRNQEPPWTPRLKHRFDTSAFRDYDTDEQRSAEKEFVLESQLDDGLEWESVAEAVRRDQIVHDSSTQPSSFNTENKPFVPSENDPFKDFDSFCVQY